MDEQAAGRGLQSQVGTGQSEIVNSGGVGFVVAGETQVGTAEGQDGGRLRPRLVAIDKARDDGAQLT